MDAYKACVLCSYCPPSFRVHLELVVTTLPWMSVSEKQLLIDLAKVSIISET